MASTTQLACLQPFNGECTCLQNAHATINDSITEFELPAKEASDVLEFAESTKSEMVEGWYSAPLKRECANPRSCWLDGAFLRLQEVIALRTEMGCR
jgi:hypothetical protein